MNLNPRQTVSAGILLRPTLCPRADILFKGLNLNQRLFRVRFCPRGPVMDTLHGSSALLNQFDVIKTWLVSALLPSLLLRKVVTELVEVQSSNFPQLARPTPPRQA
jgi:hypothetical protein